MSLLPFSLHAEIAYAIPKLDETQITAKKHHFDRKHLYSKYVQYGSLVAAAAGLAYMGYNHITTPVVPPIDPLMPTVPTLIETVVKLQQDNVNLRNEVEVLSGQSTLSWCGNLMQKAILGIELNTVCKIAVFPLFGRMCASLLELDAFWYEIRSEGDLPRGILNKARRLGNTYILDAVTDEEKALLCRTIQGNAAMIAKQIEKIIGFVRHKQEQYRDTYPAFIMHSDDHIRYMMLSYEEYARTLEQILNSTNTMQEMSVAILDCTQSFAQEYIDSKDQLKVLEQHASESVS